jgi:hypothetical protein
MITVFPIGGARRAIPERFTFAETDLPMDCPQAVASTGVRPAAFPRARFAAP